MWKLGSAACALAASTVQATYVKFNIYDSIEMPNGYADGVNTYLKINRVSGTGSSATTISEGQWLVCTTCTFSYMFSDDITGTPTVTGKEYTFKKGGSTVPVNFYSMQL